MSAARLCIFGEVLFDHFADGKRVLGGAPFNVAWHLQAFGEAPHFISRVGDDAEGDEIQAAMRDWVNSYLVFCLTNNRKGLLLKHDLYYTLKCL